MSPANLSLRVFGTYMVLVPGLGLIFAPELLLDLFQMQVPDILWPLRMIGLLAFILGIYYFIAVKFEMTDFYPWTSYMRYLAAAFMAGLFFIGEAEISILLFAAVDAAGASWTLLSLRI